MSKKAVEGTTTRGDASVIKMIATATVLAACIIAATLTRPHVPIEKHVKNKKVLIKKK